MQLLPEIPTSSTSVRKTQHDLSFWGESEIFFFFPELQVQLFGRTYPFVAVTKNNKHGNLKPQQKKLTAAVFLTSFL